MIGTHKVEVIARNLKYVITLHRNITVITGESGTGKSTFRKFVQEYIRLNGKVEFNINATANYRVFNGTGDIDLPEIRKLNNTICIIDEDASYLTTVKFADVVKSSSNYFLIIYRGVLCNLPYSYKSVYKLVTMLHGDMYRSTNVEYFGNTAALSSVNLIITEDSNSGKSMLQACFNTKIEDSEKYGNSTLSSRAINAIQRDKTVLLFADGAALGGYITKLKNLLIKYPKKIVLWCPESFEYLLLQSGIVYRKDVPIILKDPAIQIESALFLSWERFFTWLVTDIMKNYKGREYNKKYLADWYLQAANLEKFKSVVPRDIRCLLDEK